MIYKTSTSRIPYPVSRIQNLRSHLPVVLLCVFMFSVALFYVQERTTFVDIAFHTFLQVQAGEIWIHGNRFVSAITQFIPTQMLRLGLPYTWVQVAYSLVFPTLFVSCFWIIYYRLKQHLIAISWGLLWIAFATHTHFWIQSELHQGLALMMVSFALYNKWSTQKSYSLGQSLLLFALLVTVAFAHPIILFPFFSLWVFLNLSRYGLSGKGWLSLKSSSFILTFGAAYACRELFFRTWYDAQANTSISANLKAAWQQEIPYSILNFGSKVTWEYFGVSVAIALLIGVGVRYRQLRVLATLTLVFATAQFLLVAFAYPTDYTRDFYIENLYLPAGLTLISGLVFCFEDAELASWIDRRRNSVLFIALLLFAFRCYLVANVGQAIYTPRLAYLERLVEKYEGRSVILQNTQALTDSLIMIWGVPYEAWALGLRNGYSQTPSLVILDNVDQYPDSILTSRDHFIGSFKAIPYRALDTTYFSNPRRVYEIETD